MYVVIIIGVGKHDIDRIKDMKIYSSMSVWGKGP